MPIGRERPSTLPSGFAIRAIVVLACALLLAGGCAQLGGICGDGTVSIFEECDDGNLKNEDGCSFDCQLETGAQPTLASIQSEIFGPICAECHRPGGTGEFMRLDSEDESYASLILVNSYLCSVLRVDPGNPNGSCLVLKIEGSPQAFGDVMPPYPRSRLTSDQIMPIRKWILRGAPR